MLSFLSMLAQKIAQKNEIPLEKTMVIVPNKRAQRELLHELARHFTQPVFAPNILSVNEFIESLSPLKKIENTELLMRLFDVYKKKNPKKNADFAAFLTWAPLFLQDINEIDLYLANAKNIFTNLADIKNLETSFGKENLTETQRIYLHFYSQLAELYTDLTENLRAENLGYEGMIYKETVAVCYGKQYPSNDEKIRYIFAGLNAVTPTELEILHYFYLQKNAEFYFDIDNFYAAEYGGFIEQIRQKLRLSEVAHTDDYKNIPKEISCFGAPKRTAQIYKVIEILNNIEQKQGNLNNTALVLADETMLLPFVHAYNTENANITMGYPLSATFSAQQLQQFIDEEKQNNSVKKPVYDLKTQGFEFLRHLLLEFQTIENEKSKSNEENYDALIVNLLEDVTALLQKFFTGETKLDFVVAEYFINEQLKSASIPFAGNAHEGLQIMGLLETRMLDFKNVIVLSMNEGVLPKGKASPSMLLYVIKNYFGLPTHQHKDAIFGYHFFRLLQRSENVYLVYDNESSNAPAEKSRFVEQLKFKINQQQLQNTIHYEEKSFNVPFSFPVNETEIRINKTKSIIEKLTQFKYSPTSLNTYLKCPLQFYFRFIEKITVPQQFDETNESAVLGTVIHKMLEEIFKELKENPAQFSAILPKYENHIDDLLPPIFHSQKEIENEDITRGKLFLVYEIAKKSILDYIKVIHEEWKTSLFQIIATEISLTTEVNVGTQKICLKGTADRIELRNNKVTILDYKTGKVDQGKLKCVSEDMATIFSDTKYAQLFQLLCYAYLYQNSSHSSLIPTAELQCGIIAFQQLFRQETDYICYAKIDKEQVLTQDVLHLFEDYLKQLFVSILDEQTPFCQTNDPDNCEYCDYKHICNL